MSALNLRLCLWAAKPLEFFPNFGKPEALSKGSGKAARNGI